MLTKFWLTLAASLVALACSGDASNGRAQPDGMDDETSSEALVVPEELAVTALPGGNGVLTVIALTLRRGPTGAELYAAVRNDGSTPACSPSFSVEVFDWAEQQSVAAGIGGLLVRSFYRLADGSGTTAACVGPGDVSMVAITGLREDLAIEDVGKIVYRCNYWVLDVVPIDGIRITEVRDSSRNEGVAYRGTLVNGLDVALTSPSVAVFPVTRGGRPLGAAFARGTAEVPAGGSWDFETNTVSESGVGHAAYPAGGR